ncbi:hypothetical protein [Nostoc sp. MG11]|uniref:hypothetical protein n=1 Tax=Nostoc sp. MG11 TaxID=2721166 RepID=UPI001868B0C6|nr:hypothetical protein [Nostoc sp. MG11]
MDVLIESTRGFEKDIVRLSEDEKATAIQIKYIIEGQRHDDVIEVIKSKKVRYE